MDPILRLDRPILRHPRAVLAWEGWNDACDAASGAAAFILGQYESEPFAVLEPEEFYDFQSSRPKIEIADGKNRRINWPATRFYAIEIPDEERDLVVVVGEEPNLRWKTYARLVAQVLTETDVEQALTLGAFLAQVAHTVPVPLIGVATDPSLVAEYQLATSDYEGPTGIAGVMLEAFREIGMPALSIWAAVPHYLAANPNPKAMLALLDRMAATFGITIDATELTRVAEEFQSRVNEAMAENESFVSYVRRLEAEGSEAPPGVIDPGHSDQLITEIEQFLRNRDG